MILDITSIIYTTKKKKQEFSIIFIIIYCYDFQLMISLTAPNSDTLSSLLSYFYIEKYKNET